MGLRHGGKQTNDHSSQSRGERSADLLMNAKGLFRAISVVVLVATLSPPVEGRAQSNGEFEALLDTEMPALLEEYGVSGSVVSFIDDGAVAWTRAYGLANVSSGTVMSPDMVFEFGSAGKVITAWAMMRLVEDGRIDLDAPVNSYLKRWKIESEAYDAEEVTVRRLLTHTSGLDIHGYLDFSPRRIDPPDLVRSLEGKHLLEGIAETVESGRLSLGNVELAQEPGSGYRYSGAGYAVLQIVIEDVTGVAFDEFVKHEITDPLGATSLRWAWTPELEGRAPTPYGEEGQPLEYRQLTVHGIGSEIGTVSDFARFVAAAVTGPNGESPGRGVLEPETVELMISPAEEAGSYQGFGYGLGRLNGALSVSHGGKNSGWEAFFILDTVSRQGFVVASASNRAGPLHNTITDLWLDAAYGPGIRTEWPPSPTIGLLSLMSIAIASVLTLILAVALFRFVREVRAGNRTRVGQPDRRGLLLVLPWVLGLLFGWYTVYSSLPLYLPAWYPDFWPTTGSLILTLTLTAWIAFSLIRTFFPRRSQADLKNPELERSQAMAPTS
jgi:CubicO group peptidase (beta-lactamase class C family)